MANNQNPLRALAPKYEALVVSALIALFAGRLFLTARQKSPTYDEFFYTVYGYSVYKTGDYRLSMDKTPLVPLIAALPMNFLHLKFDVDDPNWKSSAGWINSTAKWTDFTKYREDFCIKTFYDNTVSPERIIHWARVGMIIFQSILAVFIFIFTKKLFGSAPAILTLFFYTFSPNILAHASLATEDAAVTALFYLSVTSLLLLFIEPTFSRAGILGIFLGLTLIAKHSALILLPVFMLIFCLKIYNQRTREPTRDFVKKWTTLAAITVSISLAVITVFYRLESLPLYFHSIRNTLFYESRGQSTYCLGKISGNGFWYYYLVCVGLKTSIPVLVLSLFGLMNFKGFKKYGLVNHLGLAVPSLVILLAASINPIQIGLRYVLPIYPFLFCLAALTITNYRWLGLLCLWHGFASLSIHPDYLAYFNEFAGGPSNGYRYLSDANIDWGQDLWTLRDYVKQNGISDVVLSYYGTLTPPIVGFPFQDFLSVGIREKDNYVNSEKPAKEILAISVTNFQGTYASESLGPDPFSWLKDRKTIAQLGHSIYVYDITSDAQVHEWMAHLYYVIGLYDKVDHEINRAIHLESQNAWAMMLAAFRALDRKDSRALQLFESAVKADPQLKSVPWEQALWLDAAKKIYAGHLTLLSFDANHRNKADIAIMASTAASQIEPSNYVAWENLAFGLYNKGNIAEARRIAEIILKINPTNEIAHSILPVHPSSLP